MQSYLEKKILDHANLMVDDIWEAKGWKEPSMMGPTIKFGFNLISLTP